MRRSTSSPPSVVSCSCVLLTAWIAEGTQPEYQVARYSMPPMLGSHIRWVVALQHTCRVRQGLRPRRARYFCVSPPCFLTLLLIYVAQLSLTRLLTRKARLIYVRTRGTGRVTTSDPHTQAVLCNIEPMLNRFDIALIDVALDPTVRRSRAYG